MANSFNFNKRKYSFNASLTAALFVINPDLSITSSNTFWSISILYPVRLNLADFCTKKWRLSSSKILDRTPAMPAFFSSIFTIFYCTSYRPIQNVPGIVLIIMILIIGYTRFNQNPYTYSSRLFNAYEKKIPTHEEQEF